MDHSIAKACYKFHYGQAVYRMGDESDENALPCPVEAAMMAPCGAQLTTELRESWKKPPSGLLLRAISNSKL